MSNDIPHFDNHSTACAGKKIRKVPRYGNATAASVIKRLRAARVGIVVLATCDRWPWILMAAATRELRKRSARAVLDVALLKFQPRNAALRAQEVQILDQRPLQSSLIQILDGASFSIPSRYESHTQDLMAAASEQNFCSGRRGLRERKLWIGVSIHTVH